MSAKVQHWSKGRVIVVCLTHEGASFLSLVLDAALYVIVCH